MNHGIHHCRGTCPRGSRSTPSHFPANYVPSEMLEYNVHPGASDKIRQLEPREWIWTSSMARMPLTFSAPRLLSAPTQEIWRDSSPVSRRSRTLTARPLAQSSDLSIFVLSVQPVVLTHDIFVPASFERPQHGRGPHDSRSDDETHDADNLPHATPP